MPSIWRRRKPGHTGTHGSPSPEETDGPAAGLRPDPVPAPGPQNPGRAIQPGVRVEAHGKGAVAAGGSIERSVIGNNSTLVIQELPPVPPPSWPMRLGTVPAAASGFQPREALRTRIDRARAGGGAVVLTQVMSGGGGVGKTQLAASYARQAQSDGTELLLWVAAGDSDQVVAQYAQAARRVQAPGADGVDAESDARAFLGWLATTARSWLVVLDDVTDFQAVALWWPPDSPGGQGRVLATTRLRDATVSGGGRKKVDITTYTPDEGADYLRERLGADFAHLLDDDADALGEAVGRLPLALAHAAAYMINKRTSCREYVQLFNDRSKPLEAAMPRNADTENYGRQVSVALLLSLDAAQSEEPVGLAVPAIRLVALLDPAGHPRALWAQPAVAAYLTSIRDAAVSPDEALEALSVLHRYNLITDDPRAEPRAVTCHALTARATREKTPDPQTEVLVNVAAQALLGLWPERDHSDPDLAIALHTSTDILAGYAGDLLWDREQGGDPLLFRAGVGLSQMGLYAAAVLHWERTASDSERLLGPEHPDTLTARGHLARSCAQAGRSEEAITISEQVVADMERLLGPEHPGTLTSLGNLAGSYVQTGRMEEAIAIDERVVADMERLLGPEHPDTATARGNLAISYRQVGRTGEAIAIDERVVADTERLLGPEHPDTLTARGNLAGSYGQVGRTGEAIAILERVVADMERLLGPEHPDTLTSLGNLGSFYRQAGRTGEAIAIEEQVADDRERLLGPDHPATVTARGNLAGSYRQAGRIGEAITISEQVAADRERLLGPGHPETLAAHADLAGCYRQVGRIGEAIAIEEGVVVDRERLLGPEHPDTVTSLGNLAGSYWQAGRTGEAIALEEQVVVDRERLLGPDHPDTQIGRANLAASYGKVGRIGDAITIYERVVAARERTLGPEHPDTLAARANQVRLLLQAAETDLPNSRADAWSRAVDAVTIAGPLAQRWPARFGPLLRDGYLIAAHMLDTDVQSDEAERLRGLARGAVPAP